MDAFDRGREFLDMLQHIENCYIRNTEGNQIIITETEEDDFRIFLEEGFEMAEKYIRGRRWYDD